MWPKHSTVRFPQHENAIYFQRIVPHYGGRLLSVPIDLDWVALKQSAIKMQQYVPYSGLHIIL